MLQYGAKSRGAELRFGASLPLPDDGTQPLFLCPLPCCRAQYHQRRSRFGSAAA
jgi:hypothetical protein